MEFYKLNNETIDLLSEKIGEMYSQAGCTKKEIYRAKLILEEALIKYKSRMGEEIELYYRTYKIFGQLRFCVRIRAASFDPFTLEENPMGFMIDSIMSNFENVMPTWKYKDLENEILFTIKKKKVIGNLTQMFIAIAGALVLGIGARAFIPAKALSGFVGNYIEPISNAYSGLFCVMAVLLTFFAITLSIVHMGDLASIGALGGRVMRRFFLSSAIVLFVVSIPILPFFDISGVGKLNSAAKSIYDILIGFIPSNIVSPFLNFNPVHIMIVGCMFGFSLLSMGQKGGTIVQIFDECNLVAIFTNGFLNKFIAVYVGLKIFSITTTSNFAQLKSAGKMVGTILVSELVLMLGYMIYVCIKTKLPVHKFIKAVMPTFLICLSSANFGACFSTAIESILNNGTDGDTANISINLGSVFFRPASTIAFFISSLFMARDYDVEISAVWIGMALLLSFILASSMPNIPGAAVSVLTLLFAQLGLPSKALSLMIAISAILQFVTVAVDTWCLEGEIFCIDFVNKKKAKMQKDIY